MYKSTFQIDGSKQEDVVRAIRRSGFQTVSIDKPVPQNEIRDILSTLGNKIRRSLSSGDSELVPRAREELTDGRDTVVVNDFDIVAAQKVRSDPVIIVCETVPNTTSLIVKEILEEVVTIDMIKSALVSTTGRKFKTSVNDLARITNESPAKVYEKCMSILVRSCVSGFKRIDITERDLLPQKTTEKIPIMVR